MSHLYNRVPLLKIKPDKLISWDEKNDYLAWIYTGNSQKGAVIGLNRTLHDKTLSFSGVGGTNISLKQKEY